MRHTTKYEQTRTLQVWPSGHGYTIKGDIDGPASQRRLKTTKYNGEPPERWRKGTKEEWRQVRIEVRAELYGERDIFGCDSALVDDLIKAANSGELSGDLAEGFGYDAINGLYKDPSDWTAEQCREYASDHGIDLPDCNPCAEHETQEEHCEACAEMYEDDSRHGWLTEARDACREHAQDNPAEVYEWWRVSSWLCDQLAAIGEVTIDNGYGHWWGRTCTGQQWIMDGTLQQVAAQYEQDKER